MQQLQQQLEQAQAALQDKEAELGSVNSMLYSAGLKENDELLQLQVGVRKRKGRRGRPACTVLQRQPATQAW